MWGIKPVCSTMHFFHHLAYIINVPCRKRINQTKKGKKPEELEEGIDNIVSMPLANDSKPETIQLLSTEVEKSHSDSHGSFPTRNFSTKENERHSLRPWSTHDTAPVWSDKGLISYDRLLQLRRYRTPINSPAINLLHQTLFPPICSCLTSIRAPFSCLQVLVSIWR